MQPLKRGLLSITERYNSCNVLKELVANNKIAEARSHLKNLKQHYDLSNEQWLRKLFENALVVSFVPDATSHTTPRVHQ